MKVKVKSESHSVMSNSLGPHGLYSPWNSPCQNTGVGSLSLLQWIFLTQESNPGLLHCRQILYQLSYQRSPNQWICLSPWCRKLPQAAKQLSLRATTTEPTLENWHAATAEALIPRACVSQQEKLSTMRSPRTVKSSPCSP